MPNRFFVVRTALIVALGGFLMGFDASVISGVVRFIELEFGLSSIQLGWAVSSLTLTATLGMMVSGPLSDRFGRRTILYAAAILYGVSAIGSALAPTFALLVAARMLGGLAVGASLIIAPMYIAEISPPKMRGRMVSFNQLNIVIGISVAFFTNYLILQLGQSDAGWAQALAFGEHTWRWMLGLETLPAVLYFVGLFFVPQSPRWLIMKGREAEALPIMRRAVGSVAADRELSEIQASIAREAHVEKGTLRDLFVPAMRFVLTIGIVIGILQQITGINSVFFYAPVIFEQSGIGTDASFVQAIFVGLTNLVFTVVAILLIDRLGRRPLLGVGLTGIATAMFVLAFGFYQATYTLEPEAVEVVAEHAQALQPLIGQTFTSDVTFKNALQQELGVDVARLYESELIAQAISMNPMLILFGILGFVAAFAVSIGPVMWVLFSELFPNRIRGLAISFVGLINSGVSFLVQLVFPWQLATIGSGTTFLIYGLFAAAGLVFVLKVVPETKGKSLEELERQLVTSPAKAAAGTP
jgi:MFS transporter, SP family, arabinose:H+ symporter